MPRPFLGTLRAAVAGLALSFAVLSPALAFDATIQQIQKDLATLGYDPGPADGVEGRRTRSAIEQYALDKGLGAVSDAEVAQHLARLAQEENGPDEPTARAIQALLTEFGYVPGVVPGVWDTASEQALWLYLGNENGRALLQKDERTAAARHLDVLAFMQTHKQALESGANELFVPVGGSPCCFSPNSRYLVSNSDGLLLVWDVASGAQVQAIRQPVTSVASWTSDWTFTPDGDHLITGDYAFQVINLGTGRAVKTFWSRTDEDNNTANVSELKVRPASTEVLVAESSGSVTLYDWASGRFLTKLHTYGKAKFTEGNTIWTSRYPDASSVAVSPDGRYAASTGSEFAVRIYDLDQRALLFVAKGKAGMKYDEAVFSTSGRYVYVKEQYMGTYDSDRPSALYRVDLNTQSFKRVDFYDASSIYPSRNGVLVTGHKTKGGDYDDYRIGDDGIAERSQGSFVSPDGRYSVNTSPVDDKGQPIPDSFTIRDRDTNTEVLSSARSVKTKTHLSAPDLFAEGAVNRTLADLDLDGGSVSIGVELGRVGESYESMDSIEIHAVPSDNRIVAIGGASESFDAVDMSNPIFGDVRVYDAATGRQTCRSPVRAEWRLRDDFDMSDTNPGRFQSSSYIWSSALQQTFIWTGNGVTAVDTACETVASFEVRRVTNYRWKIDDEFRQYMPTLKPFYSEGVTATGSGRELLVWRAEQAVQRLDPHSGERLAVYDTSLDRRPAGMNDSDYANLTEEPGLTLAERVLPIPGTARFLVFANGTLAVGDQNAVGVVEHFEESSSSWTSAFVVRAFDNWAIGAGGKYLAILSLGTLRTVDPVSGRLIANMRSDVRSDAMSFSEDGTKLIADGIDGYRRVFDPESGDLLTSTLIFEDGEWLTLTPEGFFTASEGGAADLKMRLAPTELAPIANAYDALYRPDLVAAKLAGDPEGLVTAAAAKLDLKAVIESGSAPRVLIASPASGAGTEEETVEVAVDVTDEGGGIGKIEWRVNGVTLGIDARGFDRLAVDAQVAANQGSSGPAVPPVRVTQSLSLDPGENLIEVVAYNEKGLIASDPASVVVNWNGASASTPPTLYVLSVGVNEYYDSRLALNYASTDAKAIGAAFETAGNKLYSSVEVTTVLDADVTAANLDSVFTELSAKVRPRDVFVLFMAGHGKTQDGRYYFLPADFRYTDEASIASGGIDQDAFQAWLARIPARKSVLLYDTCDSGALTNAATNRGLEEVAAIARMTRAMGRTVLSASTDDAPALEGYKGHGVFTYALLQALGDGDVNGDGTIEVTELAGSIDRAVPEISFASFNLRQIPQMSIIGSDFPLTHKVAVLSEPGAAAIPIAPTHVIVISTQTYDEPNETAAPGQPLDVGILVRVVETSGEWSLIARDGARIGFVRSTTLVGIK
jgi:WD40 repeat protein